MPKELISGLILHLQNLNRSERTFKKIGPLSWFICSDTHEKIYKKYVYIQVSESRSVMSDSLCPHGLYSPWNSPGQNTFPFSRGSSQLRDWTQVSHIAGRLFTHWVTREAQVCTKVHLICQWCNFFTVFV